MSAIERLIAARPGRHDDDLWSLRVPPEALPPLLASWADEGDASMSWWIGPELARDERGARYAGWYESEYEGRHAVLLTVSRDPAARPIGTCAHGAIVRVDAYRFGASLAALGADGFRLSRPAAEVLHAAIREHLRAELHDRRRLHGRLAPHRIRLAVFHRPYSGADPDDPAPPIALVGSGDRPADAAGLRAELDALDAAVLPLIVDIPSGEGGVDEELAAMWARVFALDPMLRPGPPVFTADGR